MGSPWSPPGTTPPNPQGWAPGNGAGPVPPASPASPSPRRRIPWLLICGAIIVLISVIVSTAAITYAVARNNSAAGVPQQSSTTTQSTYAAADQTAAKKRLCDTFDMATRGQKGQGGLVTNGQVNLPAAVRSLNGITAIQNAITPAVPADVAAAAKKYIDANLDLTTAALGNASIEEGNRLNDNANNATSALADTCGLPH